VVASVVGGVLVAPVGGCMCTGAPTARRER
jgi:hypothetical protein